MTIIVCETHEDLPPWLIGNKREIAESIIDADLGEVAVVARRSDGEVQVFEECPDIEVIIDLLMWAARVKA